jgi:radical SAM protein
MSAPRCPFGRLDFDRAPMLAIWETTRSCALACRHCRASAELGRHREELDTAEGRALIDQVAEMGTPIVILSGGDPLNRPDIEELVAHAKARRLRVGVIPAATPNLTRARLESLRRAGLDQVAFSLDAPEAAAHDGFRGVPGSFELTLRGAAWAKDVGLPLQINTCFAEWNVGHLERMIALVRSLGVVFWEVFFLVPIGRGGSMRGLEAEQFEAAFERLERLARDGDFVVKLTEAQHFRRFCALKARGGGASASASAAIPGGTTVSEQAVNAGKGFVFIDHRGDICPSGFLPIAVGNVRRTSLDEAYRGSLLFRTLRDPSLLKGKCGRCEFVKVCGGSRARAFAMTGDYLAADPGCAYEPAR